MGFWRYGSAMPPAQRVLAVVLFCLFGAVLCAVVALCGSVIVGLNVPLLGLLPAVPLGAALTVGCGIGTALVLAAFLLVPDVRPWIEALPEPPPKKRADRRAGASATRTEPAPPATDVPTQPAEPVPTLDGQTVTTPP